MVESFRLDNSCDIVKRHVQKRHPEQAQESQSTKEKHGQGKMSEHRQEEDNQQATNISLLSTIFTLFLPEMIVSHPKRQNLQQEHLCHFTFITPYFSRSSTISRISGEWILSTPVFCMISAMVWNSAVGKGSWKRNFPWGMVRLILLSF